MCVCLSHQPAKQTLQPGRGLISRQLGLVAVERGLILNKTTNVNAPFPISQTQRMKRSREPEEATIAESPAASADDTASTTDEIARHRASKITELDESAIDDSPSPIAMKCSLPGHKEPLTFKSYGEYETHYTKTHTNRCNECRKNFPTEHILVLHIEECHDSFAAVLRERGEHTVSWNMVPELSQAYYTDDHGLVVLMLR